MNLQIFMREIIFSSRLSIILLLSLLLPLPAPAGWELDFSRRTKELSKDEFTQSRPSAAKKEPGFFDFLLNSGAPIQEVVVLNTERGFIPSTLRVREGLNYKISVVNVNPEKRNVSFVLDSFSEHHATYYGKIKTFHIRPKKEGVYSFVCPETSAQGRLVVYPGTQSRPADVRMPASE